MHVSPYIMPSATCSHRGAFVRVVRLQPLINVRHLLQDLNTDEELANVAAVSAGNNKEIGDMISKAMQRVGRQVRRSRCHLHEASAVDARVQRYAT